MINENDLKAKGLIRSAAGSWSKPDHRDRGMGATFFERQSPLASEHASEARGVGTSDLRPRITITMHRCGKPLDTDNKWIAPKATLDGLIQAFELQGDSESQIDYHVEQVKVAHRNEQKTTIKIEEINLASKLESR